MPKMLLKETPARARARRRYTSIGQEDGGGLFDDLLNLISPSEDQSATPAPPAPDRSQAEEYTPRREYSPDAPVTHFRTYGKGRVTATQLRLRAQPSTSANTVAAMPQNTIVETGPSNTDGWLYVEWSGKSGFASSQYIEPVSDNYVPSPPPSPTPAAPRPAPSPTPAPPASQGIGLMEKLFVSAIVLTIVGVPTYLLLKRKRRLAY